MSRRREGEDSQTESVDSSLFLSGGMESSKGWSATGLARTAGIKGMKHYPIPSENNLHSDCR